VRKAAVVVLGRTQAGILHRRRHAPDAFFPFTGHAMDDQRLRDNFEDRGARVQGLVGILKDHLGSLPESLQAHVRKHLLLACADPAHIHAQ